MAALRWSDAARLADVNGDNRMDIVSANFDSSSLTVMTNDGRGVFAVAQTVSASRPGFVAAGDINRDGFVDIISANSISNWADVFTNDSRGWLASACRAAVGNRPLSVVSSD